MGLGRTLLSALRIFIFFPLTLVIYVIGQVLRIRFGAIDAARFGFMAFQPDVYFFKKRSEEFSSLDVFYYAGSAGNQQLRTMWNRVLHTSAIVKYIAGGLSYLPGGGRFAVDMRIVPNTDYSAYFNATPPPISFTAEEEAIGLRELRKLGLTHGDHYFCFSNREASQFPSLNASSIDENRYRDFPIDDLRLVVQQLSAAGLKGVRIGTSSTPLSWASESAIDYAGSRTDFLDLFLISKCRFYLGPNSGPYVAGTLFRRPVALINVSPLTGINGYFSEHDLFIPKKYKLIQENRLMTLGEIIRSGTHALLSTSEFQKRGIELVQNTPEEIADLAMEMEARLSGTWVTSSEAMSKQALFQAMSRQLLQLELSVFPRIGTSFLKQNPTFLLEHP